MSSSLQQSATMSNADHATAVVAARPAFDYGQIAPRPATLRRISTNLLIAVGLLAILYGWLFEINARQLVHTWYTDPDWSHGFLVPLIAVYLAYLHKDTLVKLRPKGTKVGLALLLYGVASQVLFRIAGQPQASNLTILVVLFGLVLWILGWDYLKILWLPICYLLFMINPPEVLYVKITTPLQLLAASAGVHLLPLFGIHAVQSATQVNIQQGTHWLSLDVAEACSGIRMLTAFFALSVALAYSSQRPVWEKLVLAFCALPIAILCNALRVTLTGVLYVTAGKSWAEGSTHATIGLAMLIPAFGLQLLAGWILDHLFVDEPVTAPTVAPGVADGLPKQPEGAA